MGCGASRAEVVDVRQSKERGDSGAMSIAIQEHEDDGQAAAPVRETAVKQESDVPIKQPATTVMPQQGTHAGLLLSQPCMSVDVIQRGVTLGYLTDLMDTNTVDASLTIQELVDSFVRPCTTASRCCMFDVVPRKYTGLPKYFVSHTWSRKLRDLLTMLWAHLDVSGSDTKAEDVLLWLDIVAINQHPYADKGCLLNDDVANLARVVQSTQQTLFCLDETCVSLTRIWCLYEVWQTFLAKGVGGLMVLMPTVDAARLRQVFETFDVMQAQATQPEDRERIQKEICSSIGATQLNLKLKSAIVDSAQHEAAHTDASGDELVRVLDKAALLCRANGQFQTAEGLYSKAVHISTLEFGATCMITVDLMDGLAICLNEQGSHDEAEDMFRQALDIQTQELGAQHTSTLRTTTNLAICLKEQGRVGEAEQLYRSVLESHGWVQGDVPSDAASLDTLVNLAICVRLQGRLQEAEPLFKLALQGKLQQLPRSHPDVIATANSLANCISQQGRLSEAQALHRQNVEALQAVLGPEHISTVQSLSNLATCLEQLGQRTEAEQMYRQVVEAMTRVMGDDNPSTIMSLSNLANCINNQERPKEAEPLFEKAVEASMRVLGNKHPSTADIMCAFGNMLVSVGKYNEAGLMFMTAADAYIEAYGFDHPKAKKARDKTAFVVEARNAMRMLTGGQ